MVSPHPRPALSQTDRGTWTADFVCCEESHNVNSVPRSLSSKIPWILRAFPFFHAILFLLGQYGELYYVVYSGTRRIL